MAQSNHIQNIALVGASGNVGRPIAENILKLGKQTLTVLTRKGNNSSLPNGIHHIKEVDYDDHASLVSALKGQQVLIISLAVSAPKDTQEKLLKAAAEAGVEWIMPNEYSSDHKDEEYAKEIIIGPGQVAFREAIEKTGLKWVSLSSSFWFEWSLSHGPLAYGINIPTREVLFFGEGTQKISTTTWPLCGEAVAKLFNLPISTTDGSPSLNDYKNKPCFVQSFNVSQRDLLDGVQKLTGTTDKDWTINKIDPEKRYKHGLELMQQGNLAGFAKALYTRSFYPGTQADFQARGVPLANKALGLEQEDFDHFVKLSIERSTNLDAHWEGARKFALETDRQLLSQ